jgi:SagB-type dehydrogenase family enzyme
LAGPDARAAVRAYHDQTKHHFNRFARSLGYLDWATQPNPFRTYAAAQPVDLVEPFVRAREAGLGIGGAHSWTGVAFDELAARPEGPRLAPGLAAVSVFLRYSLGLSAWKQAGPSRWALRVNPSSGNLHPTEGYVVLGPNVAGEPGVFHYAPDTHALERRAAFASEVWPDAVAGLPPGTFLAALTSIHWREAWKYGERAFRYCQHDIGHAVAAMRYAAALMGWDLRVVSGWTSASLAALLGLDRADDFAGAEPEEPGCLMTVSPLVAPAHVDPRLADGARAGSWAGRANQLSSDRVAWDWIDTAAEASRVTHGRALLVEGAADAARTPTPARRPETIAVAPSAERLLRQRRSAQDLDGESFMELDQFLFMMRRLLPESGVPFDALPSEPRVHLAIFVHRVRGLEPGIYALVRADLATDVLRASMQADFLWVRPAAVPDGLPLFLLAPVDCRRVARQLSCAQDIAADGFFSLGMLAEFDAALDEGGAARYRELFWEAGAIGQALYLEAEAAGARGTGIGCFFDDGVHELLGIADHRLQSLYHFTVGMPIDDPRLSSHPAYPWE